MPGDLGAGEQVLTGTGSPQAFLQVQVIVVADRLAGAVSWRRLDRP